MSAGIAIEMLGRFRRRPPRSMQGAVALIGEIARERIGADACTLLLPGDRVVYVAGAIPGATRERIAAAAGVPEAVGWDWLFIDATDDGGSGTVDAMVAPFFDGRERIGSFAFLRSGGLFEAEAEDDLPAVAEAVSALLAPMVESDGGRRRDGLRIELLDAVGDPPAMRKVLDRLCAESGAEFCAYYAGAPDRRLYASILCREFSRRLPEIRQKLVTSCGMFANDGGGDVLSEDVFYRREGENVAYLLGDSRIESYFLVPVIFDTVVRGVLYVGSVRRDAFVRENIAAFRSFAEEDGKRTPLVYSVGGERRILEKVVAAMPAGVALVGADGEIVAANRLFRETLRLQDGQVGSIGEAWRLAGFRVDVLAEHVVGNVPAGATVRGGKGDDRYLRIDRVPIGDLSADVSFLVAVRDVTNEYERDRDREESIAMVAHELRTPLAALRNALRIMVEANGIEGEAGLFLGTAIRTVDRLDLLVDGLVDSSGLRGKEADAHPVRVDTRRFLGDASRLFAESMRRRRIAFDVEVDGRCAAVRVDRDATSQIVQNLLSNSLKHVPAGGAIVIDVRPFDPSASGEGWSAEAANLFGGVPWEMLDVPARFVDIAVKDTGDGIAGDVAQAINGPDPPDARRERPAKGLGLVIARRLAGMHGGALFVERKPGTGAAVHLLLPANEETAAAVAAARRAGRALDGMLERGRRVILFAMEKDDRRCWLEIAGEWRGKVVVEPSPDESNDEGLFLWLFGGRFAAGLTASARLAAGPLSFFAGGRGHLRPLRGDAGDALRVGWVFAPDGGTRFADLIAAARERTVAAIPAAALKGEPG